ncbi:MAG: radical SAM protein [Planctomycetota bacterium]|jgi:uncharacterized protein
MLRRSRFAHYYQQDGDVCIFHALNMEVLFGNAALLETFLRFEAVDEKAAQETALRRPPLRFVRRQPVGRPRLARKAAGAAAVASTGPPRVRALKRLPRRARPRATKGGAVDALRKKGILVENDRQDQRLLRRLRAKGESVHHGQLSLMYLIPDAACNLQCAYCFVDKGDSPSAPMTESTARQAVRYFFHHSRRARQRKIIFYGGEPLLNPKALLAAADEAIRLSQRTSNGPKLALSLLTNGLLITPELASELGRREVKVSVSVDGPREVHDKHRRTRDGAPTFDGAVAAMRILREQGLDPSISCTITEASLERWDEVLDLIIDELALKGLGFNILLPSPCPGSTPHYSDPRNPTTAILKAFQRLRALGIYEDRVMRRVKPFMNRRFHFKDCLGVGGQIAVAPDGSAGPCQGFLGEPEYFPLNVFRLDPSPYDHPLFQEWTRRFPLNFEECLECPAVSICGGGCPLAALREVGSVWEIDRRICSQVKPIHEWLVWDLLQKTKEELAQAGSSSSD